MQPWIFRCTRHPAGSPFRMLRSRIVPAFLCVALAHAALIGAFFTTAPAPEPRPLHSTAIVARLLGPAPQQLPSAGAGGRSMPTPSTRPATAEATVDARADARALRRTRPTQPQQSSSASPPALAPRAALPTTAAPSPPSPPALSASSAPTPAPTASNSTNSNAASTAHAATNDTIAVATPKRVARADCHIAKPVYPELSKRRGEAGTATVRFVIGTTGAIGGIALVTSSGFPRLDDAALEALRESACAPYVENGSPIRVSYEQAFKFGLEDD